MDKGTKEKIRLQHKNCSCANHVFCILFGVTRHYRKIEVKTLEFVLDKSGIAKRFRCETKKKELKLKLQNKISPKTLLTDHENTMT